MTQEPQYGAGLWHFAQYVDRYATDGYGPPVTTLAAIDRAGQVGDLSVVDITYPFNPPGLPPSQVFEALKRNNLAAIGITPEVYTREFCRGAFTNPDAAVRSRTFELISEAVGVARELGCDYVKLWPGQDGHDYPFQVDHGQMWSYAVTGLRSLAQAHPDTKFAIEYKPREPRVSMFFSSAAKTLLAIEDMDVSNVGILLDFGHSLYGGESPAEAARLIHSRGLLYGIDVNDNFRGWDDDLIVGSVHLTETLEFFYTLRECGWQGVW
jgi:xylose isomerase